MAYYRCVQFWFMVDFERQLQHISQTTRELNKELVRKAYVYAQRSYEGLNRLSGESYLDHCLKVVETLLPLNPAQNTLIATLFHSLPHTENYNFKELRSEFGQDIANLVSTVAFLDKVKSSDQNANVETLRRMFLVMARDLRVVLIKLAHRIEHMKTLSSLPLKERKNIARETLDVYVPIAARLGIYSFKSQMEDLSFQYLHPRVYEDLKEQLQQYLARRGKSIDQMKSEIGTFLANNHIQCQVDGRIKNLYSIYKKLKNKNYSSIDDIYDVFAIRIILPNRYNSDHVEMYDHLYSVLGLIHSKWKPMSNRFKDYLAASKPNGYQSLHTTLTGFSSNFSQQPLEIQIRSQRMHQEAENGIASHWLYEDNKKTAIDLKKDEGKMITRNAIDWLDMLRKIQQNIRAPQRLEDVKLDVFNDRIFVFTPDGSVKDLPKGATALDFAYSVHTDLGHHCSLVKVNGSVASLRSELKNGDSVEILTNNKVWPKHQWLSIVKTSHARAKIKSYLKGLDKDRSFRDGKEAVNKILKKLALPLLDDELSFFKEYNGARLSFKERVALVEEIGNGAVIPSVALKKILSDGKVRPHGPLHLDTLSTEKPRGKIILPQKKISNPSESQEIAIAGEHGVPYRFALCCKPVFPMPIVGYVTRGNSISIHLQNCPLLHDSEEQRFIEASWGNDRDKKRYQVRVRLMAKNRSGLVRDIAEIITQLRINILDFGLPSNHERQISREMVLEVSDNVQLKKVLDLLREVPNVYDVDKVEQR